MFNFSNGFLGASWVAGFVPAMLGLDEERAKEINAGAVNLALSIETLNLLETTPGVSAVLKKRATLPGDEVT